MIFIRNSKDLFHGKDKKQRVKTVIMECPRCGKQEEYSLTSVKKKKRPECRSCLSTLDQTKHGWYGTKLYSRWSGMKARCSNSNLSEYKWYGAKGITVCDEWKTFEPFMKWALANGYSDDLTIDRIDSNGNYEPSNCRFTTLEVQNCNRSFKHGVSGLHGITIENSKYRAHLTTEGKRINFGHFVSPVEAAIVRNNYILENKLHNKFTRVL